VDGRTPATILRFMAETNSWNPEDIKTLSTTPAGDYYEIFKGSTGQELRRAIDVCLQFDRIVNATEEMKEIPELAKEALKRIGQESEINARRVRRYGVDITAG
jgi:hypothetical protein